MQSNKQHIMKNISQNRILQSLTVKTKEEIQPNAHIKLGNLRTKS